MVISQNTIRTFLEYKNLWELSKFREKFKVLAWTVFHAQKMASSVSVAHASIQNQTTPGSLFEQNGNLPWGGNKSCRLQPIGGLHSTSSGRSATGTGSSSDLYSRRGAVLPACTVRKQQIRRSSIFTQYYRHYVARCLHPWPEWITCWDIDPHDYGAGDVVCDASLSSLPESATALSIILAL